MLWDFCDDCSKYKSSTDERETSEYKITIYFNNCPKYHIIMPTPRDWEWRQMRCWIELKPVTLSASGTHCLQMGFWCPRGNPVLSMHVFCVHASDWQIRLYSNRVHCVSLKPWGACTRTQEENRKHGCGEASRQRKENKGGAVDLTQPR